MGLHSTQTLGPILDGLMRNTPDAEAFIAQAAQNGVRAATNERDRPFGDYSMAGGGPAAESRQRHRSLNRRRRRYDSPPVDYPVEAFTEARARPPAPHFTNLDRPVFALINLPETVKGALFARYSRYPGTLGSCSSTSSRDDLPAPPPPLRQRRGRARRRSSTSGSSSATATTRWRSSAAPTSPASGSPTCSRRSSSGPGSARTSSSRPATSPTTRRCPSRRAGSTATTATPSSARVRARDGPAVPDLLRRAAAGRRLGRAGIPARRRASNRPPTPARSRPRRSTCCAGCCRRARCRTWGSSPAVRPTSS